MWYLDCQEWLWLEKSQWYIMINETYKIVTDMFKVLKWLTWRFNTLWIKEHEKYLQDDTRGFNVTSRIYSIRKDQHKWVIAIELWRIQSRWCWLSTPLLKIKMHWWGDDYVIVQSWCTRYGVMWHVAMQCSQSYGTNSLNPWVMPSNFSELSKDVRYWKKDIEMPCLKW
jgi:hypothetical protein